MRSIIVLSILVIVLGIVGYGYWFYYNPYSDGYREGVLQKFSRKGNVFKTHEGELIQLGFGQRNGGYLNAQYFYFSVDDNKIADSLERSIGKIVKVHYNQYRRSLPWRGENYDKVNPERGQYIVDGIADVRPNTD
ncbi:MAG: hypothetical protein EOP56_01835 [Sphingobacteriales bacterium]|nr:MAG: hypothetical protein EOP56_01835 [Sphingobacteriales bacterium]